MNLLRRILAGFARNARSMGFGLAAQTCSAATNFGLVVIAGRLLGPSGLATILIGFAAYVLLLGFLRALISDPLLAGSSGRNAEHRRESARAALTLAVLASLIAAAVLGVIGLAVSGQAGRGMVLFAPWVAPALVQDLGRSIVFRDRTGPSVVTSDATWLLTMAAATPLAFAAGTDWAAASCWGAGAAFGAAVALWQVGWRPVVPRRAIDWWRREAGGFARWLGAQALLYNGISYATVLLLAGTLGGTDYGGFRAVQSVFAPLSLLGPAIALPGLPLVSRHYEPDRPQALKLAAEIAALITAVTTLYVGVLYGFPEALVVFFGDGFSDFTSLILPLAVSQVLLAPTFGLTLFLKAGQRGPTMLWLGTLYATAYLALTMALGTAYGVSGAAWGAAGASAVGVVSMVLALRSDATDLGRRRREAGPRAS